MLSGDATNTNFTIVRLIRLGFELMSYSTRGEVANHYTTDAVGQYWIPFNRKRRYIANSIRICIIIPGLKIITTFDWFDIKKKIFPGVARPYYRM